MSAGLIAHKVGMSRIFTSDGDAVAVTYLKVEPNTVVRCKNTNKDGYNAVVLGVGEKEWTSRKGKKHVKYSRQKEWQVESTDSLTPGTKITAAVVPAEEGTMVTITAYSKGRGFQGVIKRHGFSRGPETHGSHHHREPGSVGMKEWPGRVIKGKKMPGRMGQDQITSRNVPVVVSDAAEGIIAVKGPVPGPNGGIVYVTFEFEPDFSALNAAPAAEAPAEEKADAPAVAEEAAAPAEVEAPVEEAPAEEEKKEEAAADAPAEDKPAEEPKADDAPATDDSESKS